MKKIDPWELVIVELAVLATLVFVGLVILTVLVIVLISMR